MRTDLLLDANLDLPVYTTGLMPVGPSDLQHQRDMFVAHKGEWKQFPQNGIGISSYLKSSSSSNLSLDRISRQQLQADGYNPQLTTVKFESDGTMKITVKTNAQ